jgi:hypothetical protein
MVEPEVEELVPLVVMYHLVLFVLVELGEQVHQVQL